MPKLAFYCCISFAFNVIAISFHCCIVCHQVNVLSSCELKTNCFCQEKLLNILKCISTQVYVDVLGRHLST